MTSAVAERLGWTTIVDVPGGDPLSLAGVGVTETSAWADAADDSTLAAALGGVPSEILPARATDKRRREWIAGRVAARACLESLAPGAAVVVRKSGRRIGQPYGLLPHPARELAVSISHTGDHAVAAAYRSSVGIDMEVIAPRSQALLDMAFTDVERASLASLGNVFDLCADGATTLRWCAKESALKVLGIGLRAPLRDVEVLFPTQRPDTVLGSARLPCGALLLLRVVLRCSHELAVELETEHEVVLTLLIGRDRDSLFTVMCR